VTESNTNSVFQAFLELRIKIDELEDTLIAELNKLAEELEEEHSNQMHSEVGVSNHIQELIRAIEDTSDPEEVR
jgi:sugar-specific transcriptional regulator TrmB